MATDMISSLFVLDGLRSSAAYLHVLVDVATLAKASSAARKEDVRWIAMVDGLESVACVDVDRVRMRAPMMDLFVICGVWTECKSNGAPN